MKYEKTYSFVKHTYAGFFFGHFSKKLKENKLKESKNSSKFSKKLRLKCQKPQNPATMTQLKSTVLSNLIPCFT